VLALEVLVLKSFTIDGLSTSSVSTGEITALEHELRDYTVESGALIAETILACAKLAEIASSLWYDVVVEPEHDPAQRFVIDRDIEIDVAHDCVVEDGATVGPYSVLAGHVIIQLQATIGHSAAFHQWCVVGRQAMVAMNSSVGSDVPPFTIVRDSAVVDVNSVALSRSGRSAEEVLEVRKHLTSYSWRQLEQNPKLWFAEAFAQFFEARLRRKTSRALARVHIAASSEALVCHSLNDDAPSSSNPISLGAPNSESLRTLPLERTEELLGIVISGLAKLTGLASDRICPDGDFADCGLDSLLGMNLASFLQSKTGCIVTFGDIQRHPTPQKLAVFMQNGALSANPVSRRA